LKLDHWSYCFPVQLYAGSSFSIPEFSVTSYIGSSTFAFPQMKSSTAYKNLFSGPDCYTQLT